MADDRKRSVKKASGEQSLKHFGSNVLGRTASPLSRTGEQVEVLVDKGQKLKTCF
jgi:hypothetical protein